MLRFLYACTILVLLIGDVAHAQGIEWTFHVRRWGTSEFDDVQATLLFEGRFARVWVDLRDTGRSAVKSALPKLERALDTAIAGTSMNITPRDPNKGILQNDIEVFGDVPTTFSVEGKTDFLMLDLDPGILGYFSPYDQTTLNNSNQMNLLYIDSREGLSNMTMLLSTIAHEFQHLIHYVRYPQPQSDPSYSFFNEGLSENANLYNGYYDRQNTRYLQNTNIDLFAMHSDQSTQDIDYQRAMTFVHYLAEQFGERFIYEFTGMRESGLARITKTLEALGIPGTGEAVLKDFAVANLLQIDPNPTFGYRLRLSVPPSQQNSPRRASVHENYTGTAFPASTNIVLQAHGMYYIQYNAPGPMRVRLGGTVDARAMMVAVRNGATEIVELQPETDYTLPLWAGGPYDKVTVAIVNAGSGVREATWTAEAITAGAGGEIAAAELSLSAAHEEADGVWLRAELPTASPARIELFDLRGKAVRTLELDSRAGTQSLRLDVAGLPSGGYVARIAQSGRSASAPILVTR
jgi:hypothetical protein